MHADDDDAAKARPPLQRRLQRDRNPKRRRKLTQLNVWRNAVVHQDFNLKPNQADQTTGTRPNLLWVRRWRKNCEALAKFFDAATRDYVGRVVGHVPW